MCKSWSSALSLLLADGSRAGLANVRRKSSGKCWSVAATRCPPAVVSAACIGLSDQIRYRPIAEWVKARDTEASRTAVEDSPEVMCLSFAGLSGIGEHISADTEVPVVDGVAVAAPLAEALRTPGYAPRCRRLQSMTVTTVWPHAMRRQDD